MSTTYDLLYRGGVTKENNVRYLTSNTPPTNDNSNKVPTTEWVKEKLDAVEDAVSGGMNATVKALTVSGERAYAPSGGGTWWCYGEAVATTVGSCGTVNGQYASGALLPNFGYPIKSMNGFGIKIA